VFDRQTERRRTDGLMDSFLIARPRLHSMQRSNNRYESLHNITV